MPIVKTESEWLELLAADRNAPTPPVNKYWYRLGIEFDPVLENYVWIDGTEQGTSKKTA